jgi:hypothetical protein
MVAPEPSEPLLLYIMASTDAVRMVLVMEQPEPQQHQVPEAKEAPGSQTQEPPSSIPCHGANTVTEP